jgi:putative NIF3 family GTP cyclohydrolase 1 type 2
MRNLILAALLALPLTAVAQQPTAQQVVDRVLADMGTSLQPGTTDVVKAGDMATPVTGIATTFWPTMEVLRAAVAQHINLILTHEPTYYTGQDTPDAWHGDPVYEQKMAYIREHHLVIYRLHDTMHDASPDRITAGFLDEVGWRKYQIAPTGYGQFFLTLPSASVQAIARHLATALDDNAIRVVGDPAMRVTHAAVALGAAGTQKHIEALQRPDLELLVIGEVPEWETIEYVRDASLEGQHKALILLGYVKSEQIGMKPFAARIEQLFPKTPVRYIRAEQPYWLLEHPKAMN